MKWLKTTGKFHKIANLRERELQREGGREREREGEGEGEGEKERERKINEEIITA